MISYPFFYILCAVVLFFHSFLNFKLCSAISDKIRFHKVSIYLLCLANAIGAPILFTINYPEQSLPYLIAIVVLTLEFSILFVGKFSTKLGIAFGSVLHLFVLRAILMASFSLANEISMYDVLHNQNLYPWVNIGAFSIQLVTLTLFIILVPLKTVRDITSNKSFYNGLLLLTTLLTAFMAFNAYMFTVDYYSVTLAVQEIVISLVILTFFYIMILSLIQVFKLGIYKEKTKELKTKIDKDKTLASAVFNFASIIMELNCTKDSLERVLVNSKEMEVSHLPNIENFFFARAGIFAHPDDAEMLQKITAAYLIDEFEKGLFEKEYEYRAKQITPNIHGLGVLVVSDEYLWYKMRINTSLNENSQVISLVTIDEIHDEKEEELQLRLKAETDPLTGAFNKNTFSEKVNRYLNAEGEGALYMFDLDNFKGINDNMGHSAGDNVLKEVYTKISHLFRSHDIIGRIGGDEFVVFLEGTTDKNMIIKKAQSIAEKINKTYYAENKVSIDISCSIGISIAPKDGNDFESLFKVADLAMYKSKNRGKNTYTIYDAYLDGEFAPQEKAAYTRAHRKDENN